MSETNTNESGAASMFNEWMKSVNDFWGGMAQSDFKMPDFWGVPLPGQNKTAKQAKKSFEAGGKVFNSLFSAFSDPENLGGLFKGGDAVTDFASILSRQAMESFFDFQKQYVERMSKLGKESKKYNFEDIDQNTFNRLREIYEKEFQKFLNIPPIGLTRFYQERQTAYLDKYALFQTALSEFMYTFYVPIEKTTAMMQDKVEKMAEAGELHDDFKTYYNMWVKELEGHYMTLLKSPEYLQVMDKTIKALVEYRKAREEVLYDLLQRLPIPNNRDMDELYKEIYELKKTVKAMSKKMDSDQ